nr:immunoglobulin heavy chain junction region [Macaca mulatta]MOX59693.1 immunoglobulin heavy chain junction region [Macaca mulatta]MOX64606.1 immunoglobulin heavy chain junction region [Macaca mulatta]MOX67711.1 immunoglobulin heavy chain junction region [Macaca mulatta]MOX67819.1 immunoglobulin heavy chain junction region [Macaca mulatta]
CVTDARGSGLDSW